MTVTLTHGTIYAYKRLGCRCAECRAAAVKYQVGLHRRMRNRPVPATGTHGKLHTYTNYGCRCLPCKEAKSAYIRGWRARRLVGAS